ncbi:hypothetical protein PHMEG_00021639 [Phytophthora megakarya]|uniref:Uncharacterized protein n=1 Tax=Phytophthora megakarya TaxID=4795 RepID=A0A225VMA3_9STRA|nr:hypothetical protein PHMEG_00021639 [Phytophthora megakarya]
MKELGKAKIIYLMKIDMAAKMADYLSNSCAILTTRQQRIWNETRYWSLIGCLLYITICTCSDVMYVITQ